MTFSQPMRSNGCGSVEQTVLLWVRPCLAKRLIEREAFEKVKRPPAGESLQTAGKVPILWRRWSTRSQDDETIVFELNLILLALSTDLTDCFVDWERSNY